MSNNTRLLVLLLALHWCTIVWCAIYPGYKLASQRETAYGYEGQLELISAGPYGADIKTLTLQVYYQTDNILRVKIYDPNNKRWEVPNVNILPLPTTKPSQVNYKIAFTTTNQFGFSVSRVSNNEVIFNTAIANMNGLIFEDQYLEISTQLPTNYSIYGLGEHITSLRLKAGDTMTLYNKDWGTPYLKNLYGSHAFHLDLRDAGLAHGVFLLNSNPMDIVLAANSLTYKTIGGVLDFFLFLGPTPANVVTQYQTVVGFPYMPPYWALGWHQCRWGYHNLQMTEDVVTQYAKNNLPLDTIWNDIDYMDAYKDFTLDPTNFPTAQVRAFVKNLHANDQHYIMIIDPGIMKTTDYQTFNELVTSQAYIRNADGTPLVGKVWPGLVYFPDFLHPNATQWWFNQIQRYYNTGPEFDGIWIDMNEASNFCNGQCAEPPAELDSPDKPPYLPGGQNLDDKSINITAITYLGPQYNTHNLYGWAEGIATKNALEKLRGKRAVVISRSTFAGTGSHNGHWLGDNNSQYSDLYYSIPGILAMQMFGVNLVGADICGFGGDTTEALCTRWMLLGAFYPFSRNHNVIGSRSQEPYAFGPTLLNASREALLRRYSLLPYFYTYFHLASTQGSMVWRPLFFEYSTDKTTFGIDQQFLVGEALLVSPVLTENADTVKAYFPADVWYDYYTGAPIAAASIPGYITLQAPINVIPVHIRGGHVITTQTPALTTAKTRLNPFTLTVALDKNGHASGALFLDDGETIDAVATNKYTWVALSLTKAQNTYTLSSSVSGAGYPGVQDLHVSNVTFLGVAAMPTQLTVNKVATKFEYAQAAQKLVVATSLPVNQAFSISWS